MPKFFGKVGYAEVQMTAPGVYENVIVERELYGDVIRNSVNQQQGDQVIPEMTLGNSFRLVGDPYAYENMGNMVYICWGGTRWSISQVVDERPRLTIRPGGVYHGPTPAAAGDTSADHA